ERWTHGMLPFGPTGTSGLGFGDDGRALEKLHHLALPEHPLERVGALLEELVNLLLLVLVLGGLEAAGLLGLEFLGRDLDLLRLGDGLEEVGKTDVVLRLGLHLLAELVFLAFRPVAARAEELGAQALEQPLGLVRDE